MKNIYEKQTNIHRFSSSQKMIYIIFCFLRKEWKEKPLFIRFLITKILLPRHQSLLSFYKMRTNKVSVLKLSRERCHRIPKCHKLGEKIYLISFVVFYPQQYSFMCLERVSMNGQIASQNCYDSIYSCIQNEAEVPSHHSNEYIQRWLCKTFGKR